MTCRLLVHAVVLSGWLSTLSVSGQQLMLPPPRQHLTQPTGTNLMAAYMTADGRGQLWLTTTNGLVRYNGQQLQVFHAPWRPQDDAYGSYSRAVITPEGRVWVQQTTGNYTGVLAYFDPWQKRIVRVADTTRVVREFLAKYGFGCLYADRQGWLWVALHNRGLLRVNPQTLTAEHVLNDTLNVLDITDDPAGHIWFTTKTALHRFNPRTGQRQPYTHDPNRPNTVGNRLAGAVRVRDNGDVLISLFNEINLLNPRTGHVRRIRLPVSSVEESQWTETFEPDGRGNDYFSTGRMVCRLTAGGELQRLEFAHPAEKVISICISRESGRGHLWVNTISRTLTAYDLNRLRPLPPFNLVNVGVNGTWLTQIEQQVDERFRRDTTGQAFLTIQEADVVQFRFAVFAELRPTRFRFKLEGYDQQWTVYYDAQGRTIYQLPAGNYTFLFNLGRADGGWSKQTARMLIRVEAPFWRRGWFLISVALVLVSLGYYFVRAYVRRQQLRQQVALRDQEAGHLRQLDELKSQFFANVTHEFRTPLTLILNAAEQLTHQSVNGWEQDRLATIQRNANQLTRLVGEMLDISRMDALKMEVYTKVGNPIRFVEEHVYAFTELAADKQIQLTFTANPSAQSDELTCVFDDDKLGRIVHNLLSNALKFTPLFGRIDVSCGRMDGQLTLTVHDTGIGIAADQLPHIFERFYQVRPGLADSSTTRRYEGSGVGLAYVKELTELMGGRVMAESTPGWGSVFTIILPMEEVLAPPPTTTTEPVDKAEESDSWSTIATDRPLVLVVEDNRELRAYMTGPLQQDYQVLEAADGRTGIAQALAAIPDLIVTDVMMPFVDGYELVRTLKNDERTSHIPIVILTAKSSFDSKMLGLDVGADEYLSKPFSLSELTARIRNGIRTRMNWQYHLTAAQHDVPDRTAPDRADNQSIPEKEKQFLARLQQLIMAHLTDEIVNVNWLVDQSRMSRTQLHRKLIALTNLSATGFIHSVRLDKARELLQTDQLSVAEVAFRVGYSSPTYFSKVFSEHFGHPPNKFSSNSHEKA